MFSITRSDSTIVFIKVLVASILTEQGVSILIYWGPHYTNDNGDMRGVPHSDMRTGTWVPILPVFWDRGPQLGLVLFLP